MEEYMAERVVIKPARSKTWIMAAVVAGLALLSAITSVRAIDTGKIGVVTQYG
jgi:hypothetical protein